MPANPFHGPTVHLRPFEPGDAPTLRAYLNHPDLIGRRYIPWGFPGEMPLSEKQVEEIIGHWAEAKKEFAFAVVLTEPGTVIGHARADWGWDPHCPDTFVVIAPDHQRQGYGSEALGLVLAYLFEHTAAHNVTASFGAWNSAARTFAAHHGFKDAGRLQRVGIRNGAYYDEVVVDMLRPEWKAKQGG